MASGRTTPLSFCLFHTAGSLTARQARLELSRCFQTASSGITQKSHQIAERQQHTLPHACHVVSNEILLGCKDQRISGLRSKPDSFAPCRQGLCVQSAIRGERRREWSPDRGSRRQTLKEMI